MPDNTVAVDRSGDVSRVDFSPRFNVAVPFIDRHLEEGRADKIAIRTTDGATVTYGTLAENVNRCGNALAALGLGAGDRVLMVVKDCPAFFHLFWGAIKAGIVPVPLNTLLRAPDYRYMIEDSRAAALVYSPEFAGEVEPAAAAAGHRPSHIVATEGRGRALDTLIAAASPTLDAAAAAPEDDCFWLYSSGSTGPPKGAVHAHRSMVLTSQLYAVDTLGFGEEDCSFSAAKLFFAYGLGNAMTFPLWVGGSCVLEAGRPTPGGIFDTIARFRPSHFFAVPTLYAALLAAFETGATDLGSLRSCVSAGEALPPDILRRWRAATALDIYEGIGTTEALHIFIASAPGALKPGHTGKMVPGYSARLHDEDGNPLGADQPGNLEIHAPSAAKYYWDKPDKTAATMLGGNWLATGDVFARDADGFYRCGGRSDDMLKVGGIWCSPYEIEARLVEHPKVLEAAVVGRADTNDLIKPEAFVILNRPDDAGAATEAELREHCKAGLAPYKYPRWINFADELPKTATGKIQRFKLRR